MQRVPTAGPQSEMAVFWQRKECGIHALPSECCAVHLLRIHTGAVQSIHKAFPLSPRKVDFLDRAIAWSIKFPAPAATPVEKAHGAAKLQSWAATTCQALGLTKRALLHFPWANTPHAFATALHLWGSAGEAGEGDLWLARGVLACLNQGSLAAANGVFEAWLGVVDAASGGQAAAPSNATLAALTPKRPVDGGDGDTPLVHFLGFLLLTLRRPAGPLACELAKRYRTSLFRDPELPPVLCAAVGKWMGPQVGQAVATTLKTGSVPEIPTSGFPAGAPLAALSRQASAASVPDDQLD